MPPIDFVKLPKDSALWRCCTGCKEHHAGFMPDGGDDHWCKLNRPEHETCWKSDAAGRNCPEYKRRELTASELNPQSLNFDGRWSDLDRY